MADFVTLDGVFNANPIPKGWIQLAHPEIAQVLVLYAFQSQQGYQSYEPGWRSVAGRAVQGGLQINDTVYPPPREWRIAAHCSGLGLRLFQSMLRTQKAVTTPISLADRIEPIQYRAGLMPVPAWLPGSPITNLLGLPEGYAAHNVVVQVAENYAPKIFGDRYLLQFQAFEV